MIQFDHIKVVDMFQLGCILPNLAKICVCKSTNYNFYPFSESEKNLCEKLWENMNGGRSIVFTRKAVVDETFIKIHHNM